MTAPIAIDCDLGPTRYCGRCDEWWPADREFFVIQVRRAGTACIARGLRYCLLSDVVTYTCRACRRERQAISARARRARAS